jgi:hypothetical protein
MTIIMFVLLVHAFGMFVPAMAIAIGDLWESDTPHQRMLKLLGWEWYMALELVGEAPKKGNRS